MPTPEEDPRGYAERRGWKVLESRWDGSAHLLLVEERPDLAEAFEELRLDLKGEPGEVRLHPMLRRAGGELLLVLLPQTRRKTRSERTNLYLLLATIFTTTWAGTLFWAGYAGSYGLRSGWDLLLILLHPETLFYGWLTFSLPLLTILGIHEMGHYVYARKHNLDASLPFFIPIPPPLLLGTMGAFIAIREPIPNRRALLDVGASGPVLDPYPVATEARIQVAVGGLGLGRGGGHQERGQDQHQCGRCAPGVPGSGVSRHAHAPSDPSPEREAVTSSDGTRDSGSIYPTIGFLNYFAFSQVRVDLCFHCSYFV